MNKSRSSSSSVDEDTRPISIKQADLYRRDGSLTLAIENGPSEDYARTLEQPLAFAGQAALSPKPRLLKEISIKKFKTNGVKVVSNFNQMQKQIFDFMNRP